MTAWTSAELNKIGNSEELLISSRRADGSLRKQVIIWVVRLGEELYVRSVNGRSATWFRGAQTRHEGHIRAGGLEMDVSFVEEPDPALNDKLDEVYRKKYRRHREDVARITSPDARAATIRLVLH